MKINRRGVLGAVAVLAACMLGTVQADPQPILGVDLPDKAQGEAALAALGANLPVVARAYGITTGELERRFREDRHMAVDRHGYLFYEDQFDIPGDAPGGDTVAALTSTYAPEDTFHLHSRPGAKRVIFLDFDGHVISGTAWNANYNGGADIVAPPYNFEGDPSTFTINELTRIQQIWQRVSEDYAPFDVDVTTEYTGEAAITRSSTSDEYYGMRVLISPISSYFGNWGGVAYVGVFNRVGDYYKPALVFPEKLSQAEKYVGEAAAHETGHTLGLSHDGTTGGVEYYSGHGSGETGWAPIMGSGYSRNLTEWSKGEYPLANNTQDDLAIIAGYISFRTDDHGSTPSSATYLPAGGTIAASGTLETNTDSDVFAFTTGAGAVSFEVLPAPLGPDLDVLAELVDSAGALVTSVTAADVLRASASLTLPAGTYFLRVRGTGMGDPLGVGYTSYGSLGQYTVSGTVVDPSGQVPPVAVAGATPLQGEAPLTVQFDGSSSFDPDGSIASHAWDFGDGGTSSTAASSHVFSSPGDYTATLNVIDNSGLGGSATVTIHVFAANLPPTAAATASPSSGFGPLTVQLSGAGSTDADGSIVSWQWAFGDGTTGSGASVSHTYQAVGTYTATLTVTDDRGAAATASTVVAVQQDPGKILRVISVQMAVSPQAGGKTVRATVRIADLSGAPISGASVSGSWSGVTTGTASGTTDATGSASITSKKFKKGGTVTFTVTNVAKATYVYEPSQNVVSRASIAAAPLPFRR